MSTHARYGLLSLALFVVLGITGVVSACCGTATSSFMTVTKIGKIDCSTARNSGAVQWEVSYHLPAGESMAVYWYGDDDEVAPGSDYYPNLPHTSGSQADVMTGSTTWQWGPLSSGTRKVRVEFWVSFVENGQWYDDRALIVFDCSERGVGDRHITNIDAHLAF